MRWKITEELYAVRFTQNLSDINEKVLDIFITRMEERLVPPRQVLEL